MKVKELIEFLKKCNPESDVYLTLNGEMYDGNRAFGAMEIKNATYAKSGVYIQAD